MAKKLEIFKPGTFTAMDGRRISFSEADLAATVAAYNPDVHEAPLVIGHPKSDAPAYGHVKSLSLPAGIMLAEPTQVDAEFALLANTGKFKHLSASFYEPDAPNNPVPGVYYLRHVGFLGAQPPAVKGLKSASFADGEQGVVQFADWDDLTVARLFRNLREWMIGKFGLEEADRVISDYNVTDLQISACMPDAETETGAPLCCAEGEEDMSKVIELEGQLATARQQITSFQEQVTTRDRQIVTLTTELAQLKGAGRRAEIIAFCDSEGMVSKISPAMRPSIIEMMVKLDGAAGIEFGEGGAKTTKTALEVYQDELKALPDVVQFGESATRQNAGEHREYATHLAFGENVDESRLNLHNDALAFMEANPDTPYELAVSTVIKNSKEGK